MAPNHGQRRVPGRGVYALVACAVVATTGMATGAAASGILGGTPAPALTKTVLTSVGTGGAAGTAPSARSAISANGRYVAFQSEAALNVSASVVPPSPVGPEPGNWRVYARDQIGQTTSLLSNPLTGNQTAPTISGTGKLVSYLSDDGTESSVVVVNRQATGKGAFDTTKNLAVKTVTGTANDQQFERISGCPTGIGRIASRTAPCGPKLSADGSTLVYPAQLSPVSPELVATSVDGDGLTEPISGNSVELFRTCGDCESQSSQPVTYTVGGNHPVTFTGVTASPASAFTVSQGDSPCIGTLKPSATCGVTVSFNNAECPASGDAGTVTGTLQTNATTPDGQSSLALVAFCFGPSPASQPSGCAPPPKNLPAPVPITATEQTNLFSPLVDLGPAVTGKPFVDAVQFTESAGVSIQFTSPDCGLQLLNPASGTVDQISCTGDSAIELQEDCTANVLVMPGAVGTGVATLLTMNTDSGEDFVDRYLSVTGVSNVVIARHDKTGAGNFAGSPSTEVNVDGTGHLIPDASEPSVSATGRYVAFTASGPAGADADATSVWLHDTDAAGNGTFHAGTTTMASCLPVTDGTCDAAADADSPSISGDGTQVAFATIAANGQVYVRNTTADTTTLVSAPAAAEAGSTAGGDSYAPAMSQDASTVAYISTATDLEAKPTPGGAANLYLRTLSPGGPAASELVSPTGASLPGKDDIALPDVDAHGGLVTFQTSVPLLPAAPPFVTSVYTFEREPSLTFQPTPVSFGTMMAGNATGTITVTVTDVGPGPGTVTTAGTTPPFGINTAACAGAVLHDGGSCVLTVSLIPQHAGTVTGSMTTTVTDDLGVPGIFSVPITATIVAQPVPAPKIAVDPDVAPPGQVTDVTGNGFLPGQDVTLAWAPGLGQVKVVANASGSFTAVVVIFPDDGIGLRALQAQDLSHQVLASVKFIVQQQLLAPPWGPANAPLAS